MITFQDAIRAAGLQPPDIIEPGRFHRFPGKGKRNSNTAAWCMLFDDRAGGVFGDHSTGLSANWQAQRETPYTPTEREAFKRQAAAAKAQDEAERKARQAKAAAQATSIWNAPASALEATQPAITDHPYLKRKHIQPHGAKVYHGSLSIREMECNGAIMLPTKLNGKITSLQFINREGEKRFLPGGEKGGFLIGKIVAGKLVCVCEGFATGASIHEATGCAVIVAFDAGNLRKIAEALRAKQPDAVIVLCADDDNRTDGNPGLTTATEAARSVGGKLAVPDFGTDRPDGASDFNDLHQAEGLDAARQQINAAIDQPCTLAIYNVPCLIGTDARDGTGDSRPLTELGNAVRMFDAHGDRLRYVYDAGQWMQWRDAWCWDIGGAAVRSLAAALPISIYAEGTHHLGDSIHFAKWARTSQKQQTINAAVSLLADFERVRLPLSNIDAEQFIAGLDQARQVIDLTTGTVRAALQSDYVTKSLHVSSVGDPAKAVRWLAFLHQVFAGDTELIDWLHRWCGNVLTGSTREQFFIFAFGIGANGKSVFAELLKYLMGDYARAIAPETLSESRRQAGSATPDLAALIGARLALSCETEEGAALAETLIKSLVSGDSMTVRQLYAGQIEFIPCFKLLILGNHKPVIRGTDYGIWRRVRLVPFRRIFAPEERDLHLLDKLKSEAPHIVAWMVQGCMEWQRRGLADLPAAVRGATDDYKRDQDIIGEWLAECCTLALSVETTSSDLYGDYRRWAIDNGLRPASSVSLGRRLGERGFSMRQSSGKRLWAGLALTTERQNNFANSRGGYGNE